MGGIRIYAGSVPRVLNKPEKRQERAKVFRPMERQLSVRLV